MICLDIAEIDAGLLQLTNFFLPTGYENKKNLSTETALATLEQRTPFMALGGEEGGHRAYA